jgi:hypothetical protein
MPRSETPVAEPAACTGIVIEEHPGGGGYVIFLAICDRQAGFGPWHGDHDAGYIGGWAISGLMALATILLLWLFQI